MSFSEKLSFYADFLRGYEGEKAGIVVISDSEKEHIKWLDLAFDYVGENEKMSNIKPVFYADKVLWKSPILADFIQNQQYVEELKAYLDLKKEDGNFAIDHILLFLHKEITPDYIAFIEQLESYSDRLIIMIEKPELSAKCKQENNMVASFLVDELEKMSRCGLSLYPIFYSVGGENDGEVLPPYNLGKFLYTILSRLPEKKRYLLLSNSVKIMKLDASGYIDFSDLPSYKSQLLKFDLDNGFFKLKQDMESNRKFIDEELGYAKKIAEKLKNKFPKEGEKPKNNDLKNMLKVAAIAGPIGLGLYKFFKK